MSSQSIKRIAVNPFLTAQYSRHELQRKISNWRFVFLCSALTLICFYTGCSSTQDKEGPNVPVEEDSALTVPEEEVITITAQKEFATDYLTLLERIYVDITGDGVCDSIALYTSARVDKEGFTAWDDGHTWALVVHDGEAFYPLINKYMGGELQFWIMGAVNMVYVTETWDFGPLGFFSFTWDKESSSFTKKIISYPYDQGSVRYSKKYSIFDKQRIDFPPPSR